MAPEDLAENLLSSHSGQAKAPAAKLPRLTDLTPEKVATDYVDVGKLLLADPFTVLTSVVRFMAHDLFHHPVLRGYLKKLYFDQATVSTEPTMSGRNTLTVEHPFFLTKRIARRPIIEFDDDLWLKLLKMEREGLIKVRILLPWIDELKDNGKEFQDLQDTIYNNLLKFYIAPFPKDCSEEAKNLIIQWNIMRGEVLRVLLSELAYPFLEQLLRDHLLQAAESFVLKQAAVKFKALLMKPPLRLLNEEDISEKPHPPRIISCIIEPGGKNISFIHVSPSGELKTSISLRNFGSSEGFQEPLASDFEDFSTFFIKNKPEVVLISARGVEAKSLKQFIRNFLDSQGDKNIEVLLIDPVIPSLFAKTRLAEEELGSETGTIKEGVSLARLALNPIEEVLKLWSWRNQDNAIFYGEFHPLLGMVRLEGLRGVFEKTAVESVCAIGIDLSVDQTNQGSVERSIGCLEFLPGLGRRKGREVRERILREGGIRRRSDLLSRKIVGKKVGLC